MTTIRVGTQVKHLANGQIAIYRNTCTYHHRPARITEDIMTEMQTMISQGATKKAVCDEFGICFSTLSKYLAKARANLLPPTMTPIPAQ